MTGSAVISPRHPSLGRLRRLSRQRRARTEEGAYVIDGPTLLAEALDAGVGLDEVIAEPDAPSELLERVEKAGVTLRRAPAGTLARAVDTVTPQPTAAIARLEQLTLDRALSRLHRPELVLVLVAVNDPGNAGTLVRSAEAAGVGVVVFADNSVDPYNPKCVRSSAGSLLRVPVVRTAEAIATLRQLQGRGVRRVGAVAHGGEPYDRIDLTGPSAIVLGSEAHGLPDAVLAEVDIRATVPLQGPVDSLNVGMAGTLVCFEALRQRRAAAGAHQAPNQTGEALKVPSAAAQPLRRGQESSPP